MATQKAEIKVSMTSIIMKSKKIWEINQILKDRTTFSFPVLKVIFIKLTHCQIKKHSSLINWLQKQK